MNNLAVVVSSCDKYHYLWDIFMQLYDRYWPDCPYPIYMVSENSELPQVETKLNFINYRTNITPTGPVDWGKNLINVLSAIPSDYILYTQEDYTFIRDIDSEKFEKILAHVIDNNINYVRFHTTPPGDGEVVSIGEGISIREILPNSPWRNNLHVAIWNKNTLLSMLHSLPNVTPWVFEMISNNFEKFYCIDLPNTGETDVLPYMGIYGSSNGYAFYPSAKSFLESEGIKKASGDPIDYDIRL